MDLVKVFNKFPTQEHCIAHLEDARWGDEPICPFCGSDRVARKRENDRVGRWNCHNCRNSYNVLTGTIFKGTRVPLQKWFLGIAILMNAKKSVSSLQLARHLDLTPPTAWRMGMKIREGMADDSVFLSGIVEADETFVVTAGSRQHDEDDPPKRGRGTKQQPVIGALARGGKVVAKPSEKVTGKTLKAFLGSVVDGDDSVLITDEYPGYNRMNEWVPHFTINHAVAYAQGLVHTNTDLGKIIQYNDIKNKQYLYGEQGGFCNGCEHHFMMQNFTVDHIIAKAHGGTDHISNLQLLCGSCNSIKGTKSHEELLVLLTDKGWIKRKKAA